MLIFYAASEKNTGLAKTVTLDTRGKGSLDVNAARKNIASLIGDIEDPDSEEADSGADSEALLVTARDLRKRAEELLKKGIKPDDATEIETLIRLSTEAIPRQDWPALEDQCNKLSDLIFYLED